MLTCAITETIDMCIPNGRPAPYQKCWWSQVLTDRCSEVHRLAQRVHSRRLEPGDPIHAAHNEARRHYLTLIKNAKKQHWEGFLTTLDEKSVWTAHHYASSNPSDGSKARIPTLKVRQTGLGSAATQVGETNQEKSHMLRATFFP